MTRGCSSSYTYNVSQAALCLHWALKHLALALEGSASQPLIDLYPDVSEALDCASSLRQGDAAAAERDEASLHLPPSPAPRTGEGDGSLAAPAQPPSPSAPTPSSPDGLRCENCGRPVENDERFCHLCDGRD